MGKNASKPARSPTPGPRASPGGGPSACCGAGSVGEGFVDVGAITAERVADGSGSSSSGSDEGAVGLVGLSLPGC